MQQYTWYQVKFNADGNVIDVELASKALEGNEIVGDITKLETAVNEEDTVLYYEAISSDDLSLTGRTLWLNTKQTEGFRVAEDVKVVLIQTNNNTDKTYFESGVSSLKTIVNDLNDRHSAADTKHNYQISAIIEKGVATSVVIYDVNSKCDPYQKPDWGTTTGEIKTVALDTNGAFSLKDSRGNFITSGKYKYELQMSGVNGYIVVKSGTVDASTDAYWSVDGKTNNVSYFANDLKTNNSYRLVVDGVVSDVILK